MITLICALFMLIFHGPLAHAAPAEPATINININSPTANSNDSFQRLHVETVEFPAIKSNPPSESEQQINTHPQPQSTREHEYTPLPPGVSLLACGGTFDFSIKTPNASVDITPLFPFYNNNGPSARQREISCTAAPTKDNAEEMKVFCKCHSRLSGFEFFIVFLASFGGFIIFCGVVDFLCGKSESANGQNVGYSSVVSQSGSEMEKEGKDVAVPVVDDEVDEDFDDSNHPMG